MQHNRQIEKLQNDVIAKQMDRDSLRSQINKQSLSPLFFLNDDSRETFWELLAKAEASVSKPNEVQKPRLDLQVEIILILRKLINHC